jgi:hypothetical protein
MVEIERPCAKASGPIVKRQDLSQSLADAIGAVEAGEVAVVDVRVEAAYFPASTAPLTPSTRVETLLHVDSHSTCRAASHRPS